MTKLLFPGMVAATMLILTCYADADILVGVVGLHSLDRMRPWVHRSSEGSRQLPLL